MIFLCTMHILVWCISFYETSMVVQLVYRMVEISNKRLSDYYDFAALLEKIRKVVKYIDSSMLEAREMRGGNGSIYLKVLQL